MVYLTAVLWLGVVDLAAWNAGSLVYGRLTGGTRRTATDFLAWPIVLGLCIFGMLAFVLASLQLLFRELLIILIAISCVAGAVRLWRKPLRPNIPALRLQDFLALAFIAFVLLRLLPQCFSPDFEHDSLVYHMTIPQRYLQHHGFFVFPYNLFFHMPHNIDLLYAWPLSAGGFLCVFLFSFQFNVLILLGLLEASGIFNKDMEESYSAGLLLGVLYLSSPALQWQLGLDYVEPAIGCFLLFSFLMFLRWLPNRSPKFLTVSFALAGWILGSKYTTWFFVPGLLACVAVAAIANRDVNKNPVRTYVLALVALTIPVLPWLIKSWLVTGNPLYPSLYSIFDGKWWSVVQDMQLSRSLHYSGTMGEPRTFLTYIATPWHLIANSVERFYVHPFSLPLIALFVASPLLLSSYKGARKYAVVISWIGFLGWIVSPAQQGRFLVSLTPLMAVAAGLVLAKARRNRVVWILALVLIYVCGVLQFRPFPRRPWYSSPAQYIGAVQSGNLYPLWSRVNRELPSDAKLFVMFENRILFLQRECWVDSVYEAPSSMQLLRTEGTAHRAAQFLRKSGITHLVVNWDTANHYLRRRLPIDITHPILLPQSQFELERRLFYNLLRNQTDHLFNVKRHSVYRLRGY